MDNIHFEDVTDIDNDVSGLGALSWLKDRVRSWTIGHLRGKILFSIENEIKDAFNYAIHNTNCTKILKLTVTR
ncbi:hypothetical protein QE152_g19567 [Popillia japonica]|uniref:Uncharacterized protein n=1 Tax=Popillia japonica TaxID=7064 RepID=A0AAW1KSQ7_POPJA